MYSGGLDMDLDAYVDREKWMAGLEWAHEGKLVTWVLAPRHDPETLDFLCSCETYRRGGLALPPGATSAEEATFYAIAAVYTPPHHRNRGAAGHMMSLLHHALGNPACLPTFPSVWGAPPPVHGSPGIISVLYSDIGRHFYSRFGPNAREGSVGWQTISSTTTVWDVTRTLGKMEQDQHLNRTIKLQEITSLDECEPYWQRDAQMMREQLAEEVCVGRHGPPQGSDETIVSFTPDQCVTRSTSDRHIFLLQSLNRPLLKSWGAVIVGDGDSEDELNYATWSFDEFEDDLMSFTRLRCKPSHFPYILHAALRAANVLGIARLEAWSCPQELLDAPDVPPGRTEERSNHLPCIAWYGSGRVRWVNIEKFPWA